MDIDKTMAEVCPPATVQQSSTQTVQKNEAPAVIVQKPTHGTFQLSKADSSMSLAKITAALSNGNSSGNLTRIATNPSQGSLAGSRKFTPIQPVFNDFATAYSSIRSGNSKVKNSENDKPRFPFRKRELAVENMEDKHVDANLTNIDKPPAIPPRSALRNTRNLTLAFGDLPSSEIEQNVFSVRTYGSVFGTHPPAIEGSSRSDIEISENSGLIVQPPATPSKSSTKVPQRPTSSVYSFYSPSPAREDTQSSKRNLLSPAQVSEKNMNLNSLSPIVDQTKCQPGLFHSSSEPVVQDFDYNDIIGDFDDGIEHYGYNAEVNYEENRGDQQDLIILSPQAPNFEEQSHKSASNISFISASNSAPHSEQSTVLHYEQYAGDNDDLDLTMPDEDSDNDSITLPKEIPTATKFSHNPSTASPPQKSVNLYPASPFGFKANLSTPASGNPPNIGLPRVPAAPDKVYLSNSSSGVIGLSSSYGDYGDTRKLLDLTVKTPTRKIIGGPAKSASPLQQAFDGDNDKLTYSVAHNRLERDISIALQDITEDSGGRKNAFFPKTDGTDGQTTPSSFKSVLRNLRLDQKRITKMFSDGYYSNSYSPSRRLRRRKNKMIRIPIRPIADRDTSPTKTRISESSGYTGRDDDPNDWETVADSVQYGKENNRPYVDAAFNETGSSIADFSDHKGESSSGPILAALSLAASEQVFHHARYNDGYGTHIRNAIDTSSSPTITNRRFRADGFPLNSFRTPNNGFGTIQSSLVAERTSSPLQDYSNPRQSNPRAKPQYNPQFNERFQQSGSISTTMDATFSGVNRVGPSTPKTWVNGANNLELDMSERIPMARGLRNQEPDSPDSYMQMIIQANGGRIPHYMGNYETRTVGSSIADASTETDESFDDLDNPVMNAYNPYVHQSQKFENSAAKDCDGTPEALAKQPRTPLIKGPPGAFYRSLCSKAGSLRATKKQANAPTRMPLTPAETPKRAPVDSAGMRKSPSRILRPLSLVAESLGPIKQVIPEPTGPQEYLYKSPLAPVQSAEWKQLYSTTDLNRINSSPTSTANSSPQVVGEPLQRSPWTVHEGSPRMTAWIHDNSSYATNTAERKSRISTVAIAVCMVIPPALLLMWGGWLDQFMVWYTKGEISRFGKTHKKVAGYLFAGYVCSATIAAIITVIIHSVQTAA